MTDSASAPRARCRVPRLLPVLLVMACASGSPEARRAPDPLARGAAREVVEGFYAAILETGTTGAPTGRQLRTLSPFLSAELRELLAEARTLHDEEARVAPDEKPAFAEGSLFTSLFEGHSRLEVLGEAPLAGALGVTVRFTYDRSPPAVSWTEQVIVRLEGGRAVVADVEYGGDWPFANQGSLVASLRAALTRAPGGGQRG